jgi:acetyltransferase
MGDADAARYAAALEALLAGTGNDAVLVVPTALASAAATADAIATVVGQYRAKTLQAKPVFAVWIGADSTVDSAFEAAGIPAYPTEADAVRGLPIWCGGRRRARP